MGVTPIISLHTSSDGTLRITEDDSRKQTDAEVAAGIIPVNYAYAPEPAYDARRVGVSASASASVNATGLQDAIDSLPTGGGIVDVPDGDISYSTGLVIPVNKRVTLRGREGSFGEQFAATGATRLTFTGSGDAITGTGVQSTSWIGLTLKNIELRGSGATGHGVKIVSGNYVLLDNAKIRNFTTSGKAGLYLAGGDTQITVIRHSIIEGNYRGVQADKGAESLGWTQLVVCDGSQIHYNEVENILAQDGSSLIVRDSYINHDNAGAHWVRVKNVVHTLITGNHGELSGAASNFDCIHVDDNAGSQSLGGMISGNELVRSNQTSGTGTCINIASGRGIVVEGNRMASLSSLPPITVGSGSRDIELGRNYWNHGSLKLASIDPAALGTRVSFLNVVPFYFQLTDIAASQTNQIAPTINPASTFYRMPNTAWVVGISTVTEASVSAGTMTIEPLVSGTPATTTLTLNSTNGGNADVTIPPLQDGNKIAAGGSLRLRYTTNGAFAPAGTNDVAIVVYVAILDHATNSM
jgi:hypothetical protein